MLLILRVALVLSFPGPIRYQQVICDKRAALHLCVFDALWAPSQRTHRTSAYVTRTDVSRQSARQLQFSSAFLRRDVTGGESS